MPSNSVNVYSVEYFSSIEWCWKNYNALAHDQDEVLQFVEHECKREFRNKPMSVSDSKPDGIDSLKIEFLEETTLPFIISSY